LLLAFSLFVAGPGLALAQSASPAPEPTIYVPPCAETAWGHADGVDVYLERQDWQRALSTLAAAADLQAACSSRWKDNKYGQYNMRNSAAANYSKAADIAFRVGQYSLVRPLAIRSSRFYKLLLKYPVNIHDSTVWIIANMKVNNDLIVRAAQHLRPR
jgi:hypothetical protein